MYLCTVSVWLIVVGFYRLLLTSCAEFQLSECYFIYQASVMYVISVSEIVHIITELHSI